MNESIWPEGKKLGVCLTHDVDRVKKTFQIITHFVRDRRFYHFKSILQDANPYWTFDKIIESENKFGVKSTFFFLNETKKHNMFRPSTYKLTFGRYDIFNPDVIKIIRKLDRLGWEIGLHGSYDSYRNKNLLRKEKKDLEKILKKPVFGVRQHYLNLRVPQTWKIHHAIGLKYDASFGYKNKVGHLRGENMPFRPFNNDFLVIPSTIMDAALFKSEISNEQAWEKCIKIINDAEEKGSLITIIWHTERFNEEEFPGQREFYEKLIEECVKRKAFIGNCKDIYELASGR